MPAPSVHVQLGLLGEPASVADHHLVSAHTRVLSDGTEVFVGEHLRWNGPNRMPRRARPSPCPAPEGQVDLFSPRPARDTHRLPEVEILPGAWQLPLWRA